MPAKLTKEEFIEKAKLVHGNKYDYSKVEYINNSTKVCIICPQHGEFWQAPSHHLNGNGCPLCSNNKKRTTESFIKAAKLVHNNIYDYSKVNYIDAKTKVCIICPQHGEFWQEASSHLRGNGCPKCAKNHKLSTMEFINKANLVHNNKYDYSKVNYINTTTKVCIICPIHGEFWVSPEKHLQGQGCTSCNYDRMSVERKMTTQEFIEKAKEIHDNKYDYSQSNCINSHNKLKIICPIHGEFWQTPIKHIYAKQGCPLCKISKLEEEMLIFLKKNNIDVVTHNKKILNGLEMDFYLPQYNIAIECQGMQHFEPVDFGSEGKDEAQKKFELVVQRDKAKRELCKEKGIKMIYYSNLGIDYPYEVIENKEEILKEIFQE